MSRKSGRNNQNAAAAAAVVSSTDSAVIAENASLDTESASPSSEQNSAQSETNVAEEPASPAAAVVAETVAKAKAKAEPKLPKINITNDVSAIKVAIEDLLASCALRSREPRLSVVTETKDVVLHDGQCKRIISGENAAANVATALSSFAGDKRWLSSPTKNGWQTCRFILRRDAGVEISVANRIKWPSRTPEPPSQDALSAAATAIENAAAAAQELADVVASSAPVSDTPEQPEQPAAEPVAETVVA